MIAPAPKNAHKNTLVIATHNPGKVKEFAALFQAKQGLKLVAASTLGLSEPDETGTSFSENARLKATLAAAASNLPCLGDDSGLSVDALNGDPGIYSARWAGKEKDFYVAMKKIEDLLLERTGTLLGHRAKFVAALALALPNGDVIETEGKSEGTLTFPPRGEKGFGYDPIFVPDGFTHTYAEMEPSEKERLSHRTRAFDLLRQKTRDFAILS